MPVRIPRPGVTEGITFGVAGLCGFAPLCMLMPGAEERLAAQTAKWAPRWERSISRVAPPARRVAQKVEPRAAKTIRGVDDRLHLEKVANKTYSNLKTGLHKSGIDRVWEAMAGR